MEENEFLPKGYIKVEFAPQYKGKGEHSVNELEEMCSRFMERNHQQNIIKQGLILKVNNLQDKINNMDTGPWLTNGNNDFPQPNTYVEPWESMGR